MTDPLPSWRESVAKAAILKFVADVTTEGGPDYLAPAERIATFDNDGTLWCEQPLQVQFYFAKSLLEGMVEADPSLKERQPYKAFIEHDLPAIKAMGKKGIIETITTIHAGMTEDEFHVRARDWLGAAKHPKLGKPFTSLVYQPQLELLEYLRASGFLVFIVSGGGIDVIRSFSEEVYGIPRSQVVGSSNKTRLEERDGVLELVKLPELNSFDDREVKTQNIQLHIGRRPVLAFGNSDGDLAMMRYALTGEGPRLALLLHHDDAEREFAYDRDFIVSPLIEALDRAGEFGLTLVSMKDDWTRVFPD